jgi:hypothetical protein
MRTKPWPDAAGEIQASRATKRVLSREGPSGRDTAGGPKTTSVAPEEELLIDEEGKMVKPLIPHRPLPDSLTSITARCWAFSCG